ncbi:MAG: type II toxin-antitoxin system RelE family toxin [Candidatus Binatus sp.]
MPKRVVKLGPDAVRQFKALSARDRSRLKAAMQAALGEDDATVENKNRFRLRRPSGQFQFEFRDGDLRVFYRVEDKQVLVDAIGRKRGNQLFVSGKKVTL